MSGQCFEVPPLSRARIRAIATNFRRVLQWEEPYFPVIEVLEFGLPQMIPDFEYEIRPRSDLKDNHGLTYPDQRRIEIREDVYDRACEGDGFYRLTVAHEMGHLILHTNIPLARSVAVSDIPAYRSSEWQANCFAGELLVHHDFIGRCGDVDAAMELFGVSRSAAETQWEAFKRDKIIR